MDCEKYNLREFLSCKGLTRLREEGIILKMKRELHQY